MGQTVPLSVCVLAFNEERNLERCLKSVAAWAAELVVVDSGSTDRTREIALAYGAKIVHQPWLGMRGQREAALKAGNEPWVLALDADEEVSPELAISLQEFIRQNNPEVRGAAFNRCTWFMGRWIRHGDWYPDRKLRLVHPGEARVEGEAGHDRIEVKGTVRVLSGDLRHYSFRDIPHYLSKMQGFVVEHDKRQREAKRPWSLLGAVIRPWWRFFRSYFLRLGFLDGFPGFWIAISTAYFAFARHSMGRESTPSSATPSPDAP